MIGWTQGAIRGRRGGVCVVLLLLAAAMPVPAAAEDAAGLLERVLEAYGGRERLAAVERLHASGTTSSLRTGTRGPSERWYVRPDKLRIDIRYSPTHAESRILDGEQAWRDGTPAGGPFVAAMRLQAARFGLPLILARYPLADLGERSEGGRSLRVLRIALGDGMSLDAAIDPATARIEHSRGVLSMGGQEMAFATGYADFRWVAGVLFPHREEHFAMGMRTGETVLSEIRVNPALIDGVFRP